MRGRAWVRLTALLVLATMTPTAAALGACPPARSAPDEPAALVLSGGGAKGAWEAGVAAALVEQQVPIRLVAGSSAGALNATMVADGRIERLEAAWRALTREQVYALRPSVLFAGLLPGWLTLLALDRAGAIFDPRPLHDLVTSSLDLNRVRASPVHLLVIATDLARREKRVFDNRTLTVEALMAAVAIPGAFPPVKVDGDLLVDGGVTGRAPVLEALEHGIAVRRAIVVMSYASDERGGRPVTLRRTLEEAFEMAMIHQIRRDTELARLRHRDVDVLLLTPSSPLGLRPLDFEPAALAEALARGRADALACLRTWEDNARPR